MDYLFKLRGSLTNQQQWILGVIGIVLILVAWEALAITKAEQVPVYDSVMPKDATGMSEAVLDSLQIIDDDLRKNATETEAVYTVLPRPMSVFTALGGLFQKDNIGFHINRSVWLNLKGYFWALVISIPLGLLIGLLPLFRGLFSKPIDAMRFLPLTALTVLFIYWFGIDDQMKVAFLAVGIIVYLLPVVVQRVHEVADIHLKTVFTLGANWWKTLTSVYIPSVMSKLIDDIRVLTAISWTYIIIVELLKNEGGLGALIQSKLRQGYLDKVFAILFIIILIGIIQDFIFMYLDKVLFPHKYYKQKVGKTKRGVETMRYGSFSFFLGLCLALAFDESLQTGGFALIAIGIGFIIYGEIIIRSKTKEA